MKAHQAIRVLAQQRRVLAFVKRNPQWRRDRVAKLFAEPRYLSHWESPTSLGAGVDPHGGQIGAEGALELPLQVRRQRRAARR